MKQRLIRTAHATAPIVLLLALATAAHAQSGLTGLDNAYAKGAQILTWLRNIALIVFVGSLVWGCIECAVESWREGRGKVFTSIGCGILAGVAQALISGLYSVNG